MPASPPAANASYRGRLLPMPPQLQLATVAPFSTENSTEVMAALVRPPPPKI